MKTIICIFLLTLSCRSLALTEKQKKENARIDKYLCIGTKVEYEHCHKNNFKECIQSNINRYRKLDCLRILKGLKIDQWNNQVKKKKYEWEKTCNTVADEFSYCLKKEISPCMGDMLKRFNDLYCHRPTRKRIYDLIKIRELAKKMKSEFKRLKDTLK